MPVNPLFMHEVDELYPTEHPAGEWWARYSIFWGEYRNDCGMWELTFQDHDKGFGEGELFTVHVLNYYDSRELYGTG